MPKLSLLLLLAGFGMAAAGAASAQPDAGAIRQACQADAQKLCAAAQPGGGRIIQCLRAHADSLSGACKAALAQLPVAPPPSGGAHP